MHVEAPAIGTYPAGPWPNVTAGALAKGSFIVWPYIQGDSQCKSRPCNTFNWAQLDAYVSLAASHGIDYLYAFDTVPMWAVSDTSTCFVNGLGGHSCTGMVANTADWDNYVTALVTRYDGNHGHGRISAYDLWNEPDESLSFTGTVANMVTLTQHSYNIIRSINPTAVILSPSGGSTYMDSYWAAGGLLTVDAVNFHAYPDTSLQANDVAEKLSGYLYVTSMKPVFAKYGLSNKPVWDSEGSWGCVSNGAITDPTLRSAFIVRWYLEHWSLGIARSYWYDGTTTTVARYRFTYSTRHSLSASLQLDGWNDHDRSRLCYPVWHDLELRIYSSRQLSGIGYLEHGRKHELDGAKSVHSVQGLARQCEQCSE